MNFPAYRCAGQCCDARYQIAIGAILTLVTARYVLYDIAASFQVGLRVQVCARGCGDGLGFPTTILLNLGCIT